MSLSIKQFGMQKVETIGAIKIMPDPPKDLSIQCKMACAGTAACTADVLTLPFDTAKVRLQMARNSAFGGNQGLAGTLFRMAKVEGLKSWWSGLSPALQRQSIFASIRVGLYDDIKNFYSGMFGVSQGTNLMSIRILAGLTSGSIAILAAQPTDLVKVRMQAQVQQTKSALADGSRSSIAMYSKIYRTGGILALWTGLLPNMARNSIVNATELACYDSIKQLLIQSANMKDGLGCHFASGFTAGFAATLVASPVDVIKTRIMSGASPGIFSAVKTLAKESGFFGFYKGFVPSFMRLGTWNIVMFVTFEQLKKLSTQDDFGLSGVLRNQVLIIEDKKPLQL